MRKSPQSITENIRARAMALGFDEVGVTKPDSIPTAPARLTEFLENERHGDMGWMESRALKRSAPKKLWPDVRSIIMLGLNYGPSEDPLAALERKSFGAISVYARNRDYHDVVKSKLKALGRSIADDFNCDVKVFVDTAPVMEKPLAESAGIGWQGKHTNLVSRNKGSWLFLGAIYTTLELDADKPEKDHCGSCRRCLDICPTAAFPAPYKLDARRCISYLTIEHKGSIPLEFREAIGNRIYGCDDCLAVCPWNKFASRARDQKLAARDDFNAPELTALAELDDSGFRKFFSGSPIKRIGRDRFVRNVLIAIGNSNETSLATIAKRLAKDTSPIVRAAAVWASFRLLASEEFRQLKKENAATESDCGVLAEWRLCDQASTVTVT